MFKSATSNLFTAAQKLALQISAPKCVTLNDAVTWAIGSTTTVFSQMAGSIKRPAANMITKSVSLTVAAQPLASNNTSTSR